MLWADFITHKGRLAHKWVHYFPIYERHFARFVNRDCTVLEIGVGGGGSLQLWRRYLGPLANIVGIDINPECVFEEPQITVRTGNQSDPNFIAEIIGEYGPFDIVIDDGSHVQADVQRSFDLLYPHTTGVYLVEDLHTAYWPEFGPGSFIETSKGLIDQLNANHPRESPKPTYFTDSTLSMHFYDSVIVFEKGKNRLAHLQIGT